MNSATADIRLRTIIVGLAAAYLLDLGWENLQAPLYAGYRDFFQHFSACALAAAADVGIIVALYLLLAINHLNTAWVGTIAWGDALLAALIGGAFAVLTEHSALDSGQWAYAGMPTIPLVDVGLSPVLQLMILPPLVFWIMSIAERAGK